MPSKTSQLHKFIDLPFLEKIWFVMIFFSCGLARLLLILVPFSALSRHLGKLSSSTRQIPKVPNDKIELARRIGACTERVARITPWESKCLVQAFVAKAWLQYYKIPYQIVLGVKNNSDTQNMLKAHAWVCVNKEVIVGKKGHQLFTTIATFSYESINSSKHQVT